MAEGEKNELIWSAYGMLSTMILAALVVIPAGIYVGLSRAGLTLIGILVCLPALAALTSLLWVRVEVTTQGVHVRLGPLGHPRFFRPIEEIKEVEVLRAQPLRFGGWGYRWIAGGCAIILRRGDAIDLRLRAGRRFVVTVDNASDGAAHIEGLLALRRAHKQPYVV